MEQPCPFGRWKDDCWKQRHASTSSPSLCCRKAFLSIRPHTCWLAVPRNLLLQKMSTFQALNLTRFLSTCEFQVFIDIETRQLIGHEWPEDGHQPTSFLRVQSKVLCSALLCTGIQVFHHPVILGLLTQLELGGPSCSYANKQVYKYTVYI